MIAVERLEKSYGGTPALRGVSFTARDGQVTGLLGPNGAGKTSTLRAIGGLIRPGAGRALVDGIDAAADPAGVRRRLGVLPESVGLYERLTVREHLAYADALRGGSGARVDGWLAQLGLAALADRRAGTLSFGERRRVALAQALVHEPPNVILDEPTSGLDVPATREVRREIRRLAASGCAVVLSTHVMAEAAALCDRLVVLAAGRVVADATPAGILAAAGRDSVEEAFVSLIGSGEGLHA